MEEVVLNQSCFSCSFPRRAVSGGVKGQTSLSPFTSAAPFSFTPQDTPSEVPKEPPHSHRLCQSLVSQDHCYLVLSDSSKGPSSPSSEDSDTDTDTESAWKQQQVRRDRRGWCHLSCPPSSLCPPPSMLRPTPRAPSPPVSRTETTRVPPPGGPQPCPCLGGRRGRAGQAGAL